MYTQYLFENIKRRHRSGCLHIINSGRGETPNELMDWIKHSGKRQFAVSLNAAFKISGCRKARDFLKPSTFRGRLLYHEDNYAEMLNTWKSNSVDAGNMGFASRITALGTGSASCVTQ